MRFTTQIKISCLPLFFFFTSLFLGSTDVEIMFSFSVESAAYRNFSGPCSCETGAVVCFSDWCCWNALFASFLSTGTCMLKSKIRSYRDHSNQTPFFFLSDKCTDSWFFSSDPAVMSDHIVICRIEKRKEFEGHACVEVEKGLSCPPVTCKVVMTAHDILPKAGPHPLEAILVIFGRGALNFFFESSWKKMNYDNTLVRMRSGDHQGDAKMSKKGTSLRRI